MRVQCTMHPVSSSLWLSHTVYTYVGAVGTVADVHGTVQTPERT